MPDIDREETPLLQVSGLKTWFGRGADAVRAVDGVDFDIARGETFALLGESGCGKSMTALSIMGLLPKPAAHIEAGRILLQGEDLLALPEVALRKIRGQRVAMIFQEPQSSLNPVMTIGEQIAESVRQHLWAGKRRDGRQEKQRVIELLDAVGIPDPERRRREYPHQLSGGLKQRVMIAIALAGEPDLLIADEPSTALDVTIQAQVLGLLRDLQRQRGMSILLITHDLGVVAEMADRIAVMYAGHVVELADSDRFFATPAHPYSRKLFASLPGRNNRHRKLEIIRGAVPRLNHAFTGCRFASRCDQVTEVCQTSLPEWFQLSPNGHVRCHLYADGRVAEPLPQPDTGPAVSADSDAGQPGTTAQLDVRDLKVHFPIHRGVFKRVVGQVRAVDGVDLSIPLGRTLALVGESGCGKTTAGKGILQLIRPTAGSVRFDGDELTTLSGQRLRERRSDIQIIFQDPYSSMNPRMLVSEIVAEGMVAQGIGGNRAERDARVIALLQQVGLDADARLRYPHEFSGGQRQRICIARALAVEPKLIVCDEPTSALDVSVQAQILNLLKDLQQQLGLSYLFITHNISVVEYLAHEVAVMYLGRIVEQGRVEDLLQHPKHPYTQALLSAVPVPDKHTHREVIQLQGELPSPAEPPSGCHFHPRCDRASDRCQTAYPAITALEDGHTVRCILYS